MSVKEVLDKTIISLTTPNNIGLLEAAGKILYHICYRPRKVILLGNGGSSSTMSHFASDLINQGVNAICLTDNIPALTAKTNDRGWDNVYVELLKTIYQSGDIMIIATVHGSSGKSPDGKDWSSNLMKAGQFVRDKNGTIIILSGNDGGEIKSVADISITIPSKDPYVVEGVHSVWCHAIISYIEQLRKGKQIQK